MVEACVTGQDGGTSFLCVSADEKIGKHRPTICFTTATTSTEQTECHARKVSSALTEKFETNFKPRKPTAEGVW